MSSATPPTIVVTLYAKPGCHLCEPVADTIAEASRVRSFEFVKRNILDDPAEFDRYKHAIPVVTVNGSEIARYRLNMDTLLAAIDAAAG